MGVAWRVGSGCGEAVEGKTGNIIAGDKLVQKGTAQPQHRYR